MLYIRNSFVFCLILIFSFCSINTTHIGLLIMATGKYIEFAQELIKSADKFFLTNHKKTYFVFTDSHQDSYNRLSSSGNKIHYISQTRLGWPYDAMMRPAIYLQHFKSYQSCQYLFSIDADMKFVAPVGSEILSNRVAVMHPGFPPAKRGSYEERPNSTAYIDKNEGVQYFAAGFYGGIYQEFYKICQDISANIQRDLDNNIIAIWHDESHLNRWFITNKPSLILNPSYCYPENAPTMDKRIWPYLSQFQPKLLALKKNHAEVRK